MNSELLINCARTWLGTPFHHQGRLKGIGCDCLGMLVGIADELKLKHEDLLLASLDSTNYSQTPNTSELLAKMQAHLTEVTQLQAGDIALMKIEGNPQHLGIITDYVHGGFGILHALYRNGVVEHALNDAWRRRIYKIYRFIG